VQPPVPILTPRLQIRAFAPEDCEEIERIHEAVGWIDAAVPPWERLERLRSWVAWNGLRLT